MSGRNAPSRGPLATSRRISRRVAKAQGDGKPRDVYLYVISGHKAHNPAAAKALIDACRLGHHFSRS